MSEDDISNLENDDGFQGELELMKKSNRPMKAEKSMNITMKRL